MPQPADEPTTTVAVKSQLSITDAADDAAIDRCVAAVNVFVRRTEKARVVGLVDPAPAAWPADLIQGATMLAARLFRRRNSPSGVEAFAVAGPVYVRRYDPDVAMLLDLDAPMVG
jgi:hypothetical protein